MTTLDSVTTEVLVLLLLLQVKHVVADYFLQTEYILENRSNYGHPGGLLHVGLHAAGSAVVLIVMGTAPALLAAILLVEAVFHYHLDWFKDNWVAARKLSPRDAGFWHATGLDQALHQASYLVLAWAWVAGPGLLA